ncbi:MAG TPA: amino acid adenylation domain-containing protein [Pseudonocardiaceae bacterium]|nr:amino acid adenylation domain-containing protein [Pseudonocardiaceae bacterium]
MDAVGRFAEDTPDAVAVQCGTSRLTYRELFGCAGALALRLRAEGVGPEVIVGISAEPVVDLVVGVLAVAMAGGAWLPMDPATPPRRLTYLVADAGMSLLVSGPRRAGVFTGLGLRVIEPDRTARATPPEVRCHPLNLAYVLYTSGSTGRPKAVMITRAALTELATVKARRHAADASSRVLQFAPATFDASVAELVIALTSGGTLVLAPRHDLLPGRGLVDVLRRERITHLLISPSALAAVPSVAAADLPDLRVIGSGGEALPRRLATRWAPGRLLLNGHGPTEVTVWASVGAATADHIGIGEPFPGTATLVVDAGLRATETGELLVGGTGVARGYLGDPGLTAARFVPDPSGDRPGARVYRTGDIVGRDVDGSLAFVGRADHQVKVRGFRVEPGEIAEVLREHPGVADAVVVPDATATRLVAYAIAAGSEVPAAEVPAAEVPAAEVLAFAAERLPAYEVPSALMWLAAFPLTKAGKVDRAALPAPARVASGLGAEPVPPGTGTERAVAAIIEELTGDSSATVGIDDDFFAIGVHSLLLGRLAVRVGSDLGVHLPMSAVFRARTVRMLAEMIDEPIGTAAPVAPPIGRVARTGPIPLSLPQQRIWFLHKLAPDSLAYHTQVTMRLAGPLDVDALAATLTEIVRRHEVLRTRFVEAAGQPEQQVLAPMAVRVPVCEALPDGAEAIIETELRRPFDLADPPLARWLVIRHGAADHTLVQVEHHFVHDGWSFGVLMSEIVALYPAFAAGRASPLAEPHLQYADFAIAQREWMRGEILDAHLTHWRELLRGAPTVLELPTDRPRPARQSFRGHQLRTVVDEQLAAGLREFSRRTRRPLFATMLAGFAALLSRYTRQPDLLIGTGSANRAVDGLESVLGMVVNTLVLRVRTGGAPTFRELVARAHVATTAAYDWPDVPVDELIRSSDLPREPGRNPLFQVMFSFHDSPVPDLDFGGLTGRITERHNGSAKTDLNIVVVPRAAQRFGRDADPDDDRLILLWEYMTDLFDEPTMRRMVDQYLALLAAAIERPDTPVVELVIGPVPAAVPAPVKDHPSVVELVIEHAYTRPHTVALEDERGSLTYARLLERAGSVAAELAARGAGQESLVVVCLPRSVDLVVAELGVLLAGAAYVPVDPDYPAERIAHNVTRAGAALALSSREHAGLLSTVEVVRLEDVPPRPFTPRRPHPLSAACVIHTSGSTGRPKGVVISHANLANLVDWSVRRRVPGRGDRAALAASPGFDASMWEIWSTLGAGASLHVLPPRLRADPAGIVEWLAASRIDVTFLTTPLAELVLDVPWQGGPAPRVLAAGGDRLRAGPVPHITQLENWYGPTETTVVAVAQVPVEGSMPPIGRPVAGATARVLHGWRPQPVGVPGELAIGGAGVGRGYLGDPARTAASYVPDPDGPPGSRMYRTGDLCRWREDGRLDFLGRIDRQVKIRGFRVEPAELEHVLREHPDVADAVVAVAGDGADRRLVAYPVGGDAARLRTFLADRLPDYLLPSAIVVLPALPIGPHGKVDLAALPAPAAIDRPGAVAPRTPTERRLAPIWLRLLNLSTVDVSANFFELGGHSLLVVRLLGEVCEEFGSQVRVAEFFGSATLAGLAGLLDGRGVATATADPLPEVEDLLGEQELRTLLGALPDEGAGHE